MDEISEKVMAKLLVANRDGSLFALLKRIGWGDLLPNNEDFYNYSFGYICVLGATEVKRSHLLGAAKELGLKKERFKMVLDYKSIEGFNFNDIDKIVSTPKGMLDTLYILADTGERLSGRELDVDREWFALHTPANMRKIVSIQIIIIKTLTDGMSMEAEDDDDKEVDVVLQEIQKKSEKTSSPGEKSQPGDSSQD
jgi:hypothetical protein